MKYDCLNLFWVALVHAVALCVSVAGPRKREGIVGELVYRLLHVYFTITISCPGPFLGALTKRNVGSGYEIGIFHRSPF